MSHIKRITLSLCALLLCCIFLALVVRQQWGSNKSKVSNFKRSAFYSTGLSRVSRIAWSLDGQIVAVGNYSQAVEVRDFNSFSLLWQLRNKNHWLVGFGQKGLLETGNVQHSFFWEARTGKLKQVFKSGKVPSSSVPPYVITATKSEIVLTNARTKTASIVLKIPATQQPPYQLKFSEDGKKVIGISNKSIVAWDIESGHTRWIASYKQEAFRVGVFQDSHTFITVGQKGTVASWNTNTGKLKNLYARNENVREIEFTIDKNLICFVVYNHEKSISGIPRLYSTVKIIDAKSGKLIDEMQQRNSRCTSVAISKNGNKLLLGMNDGTVEVWNRLRG